MMTSRPKTLNEVRAAGITALTRSLGPVDTIRFLQLFDPGHGDYTAAREALLRNPPLDEVLEELVRRRNATDR